MSYFMSRHHSALSDDQIRSVAPSVYATEPWHSESPILASRLLTVRRHNDQQPNLWSTLNRVQENMIKGGLRGRTANGGRTSTRQIKSVSEDVRLNKALWMLAESMKEIKAAG